MAGLTNAQILLIRNLADWTGLPDQIRLLTRAVVQEDKTTKNSRLTNSLLKKLEQPSMQLFSLKARNKNLFIEDVSDFIEERYYLTSREKEVFDHIKKIHKTSAKLSTLNIHYINSTLLYGESGTGKTMFGRYVAYKFNLPFVYINLSQTVGSKLGETSLNIASVFNDIREFPCVLMLDEIDSIAEKRGGGSGEVGKEQNRMVITLMQELDRVSTNAIVLGATNRLDILDPALTRRFSCTHEVVRLTKGELSDLAKRFLSDVGVELDEDVVEEIFEKCEGRSQAYFVNMLVDKIVDRVVEEDDVVGYDDGDVINN